MPDIRQSGPMSKLTVELLSSRLRTRSRWRERFNVIADRLVAAHGVPSLGNFLDPVREIFYIVLSARTTDAQYRRTYRALRRRFPNLTDLAAAKDRDVIPCIVGGGLANKRASQVRRIAARLVAELGKAPAKRLREMAAYEVYEFLTGLPGMGPKSALCVMMYSLGFDAFPVDVNVQRIASRIGALPSRLKHYQAQNRLPGLIPSGRSKELHIGMVVHGRTVCLPRSPRCHDCVIQDLCNFGKRRARKQEAGKNGEAMDHDRE